MKLRNGLLVFGIIITILSFKTDKEQIKSFPTKETISKKMDSIMKNSDLHGLIAIAVNKNGERVEYTYGNAIWNKNTPIKTNNIFRIASMTKLLTSLAALQLVEKGLIGLDQDLSSIMPEMTLIPILTDDKKLINGQNPITLRHLLTHTSGFGYSFTDSLLTKHNRTNWNYESLPRRFESGTQFLYGTSTDWIGKLIEKISKSSLEQYFKKNITNSLGMKRTRFNLPNSLKKEIVSFGRRGENGTKKLTEIPNRIPKNKTKEYSGGGGLYSSPEDYTKLLVCLLNEGVYPNGRILKKETVNLMFKEQLNDIDMNIESNYFQQGLCCNFSGLIKPTSNWSLIGLIDTEATPYGRKEGTILWGGIFNTYWYIDRKSGIVASIYTQHLPFNNSETTSIFDKFSEIIYTNNN
tara:strand:+ start:931 stop:2154 length:1224 start_codon:yes stop_codon:yes gene_type:complete